MDKPLLWLGSSRRDIRAFPSAVRKIAGFQLREADPADDGTRPGAGSDIGTCWNEGETRTMERAKARVTRSTSNVFRDLGFGVEEAEHLHVRSTLMIKLEKLIRARALTQAQAAKLMHVSQPRVSDLLRGRIDLFSTDTLIDMLARLGVTVRLSFGASRTREVA